LRDAREVRLELEDALAELSTAPSSSAATSAQPQPPTVSRSRARRRWSALAAAAALLAAFALGRWALPSAPSPPLPPAALPAAGWEGQFLLQVEPVTFGPRVSPDGKWLAFVAILEHQSQVGVMKLDSGEWWVLTRARDRGQVLGVSWARDSTRIYFDR